MPPYLIYMKKQGAGTVQPGELLFTLDNPGAGVTGEYFGMAMDVSNDYIVVGAPWVSSHAGIAYVFDVNTGNLIHTLTNPNSGAANADDDFGNSVAVDGDTIVVGAPRDYLGGSGISGTAYVFNAITGNLVHTLINPNSYGSALGDQFGHRVSISGNNIAVIAPGEDKTGGPDLGTMYLYAADTGNLTFTINNPNAYTSSYGDKFGEEMSSDGQYVIVGAHREDDVGGNQSGKAYIFNVTTGVLVHILNNPNAFGGVTEDNFGFSVDISGNYAIVGSYGEDEASGSDSGKAYIFNVTTGALVHTLDNPNSSGGVTEDRFGARVAISGNVAYVGASRENSDVYLASGKVYKFDVVTGNLLLTIDNKNVFGEANYEEFGGYSLATNGSIVAVSSPTEDTASAFAVGVVYVIKT